jgi:CubicO group peptidase (beta-lactamase class C family)
MREIQSRRRWRRLSVPLPGIVLALPLSLGAQGGDSLLAEELDLRSVTAVLEREIQREMLDGQIPSLTIALVSGGEVVWTAGFGDANLRTRTPATPSTVYMVASTFKTITAAALLILVEEGKIELDDPVRDHMAALTIRREDRRKPITFRHLLTHTSGLPTIFSPVPVWADSVPPPLKAYLEENLVALGPPGHRVRYSNMGYALIAYLVEQVSGIPFQDFVREKIFYPLGMRSTDFLPTPEMEEMLSIPYILDRHTDRLEPVARLRFAEWPAGGVWGTVEDQGRWLAMNLNGGVFEGRQILSRESVELSHTLQFPEFLGSMAGGWGDGEAGYGLGWWTTIRDGDRYIGHSGSMQGYTSFLHGNVDRGLGVAILSNGNRAHAHLVRISLLATDLMQEP